MKKHTLSSILNNILWILLSLYPFICYFLFCLNGMQYYYEGYSNSFVYFLSYIGLFYYNKNSYIYLLCKSFLRLFGLTNTYLIFLLSWVLYIQFIRIIFNLCFFIFNKCHQWLECFIEDNENDLL